MKNKILQFGKNAVYLNIFRIDFPGSYRHFFSTARMARCRNFY